MQVPDGEEFGEQLLRGARAPTKPSAQEVENHNLTHCPPRAWCDHCVKGQMKDVPHRSSKGVDAESDVPRVNLDYFFLKDDVTSETGEHTEGTTSRKTMTCLCMQESLCHSVWGYAVRQKGAGERWVVEQLADDIAAIGMAKERIIVKSDQEASITDVQNALVMRRTAHGTALENSRVGDIRVSY